MPKFRDKREQADGRDFPCQNSWTKGSELGGGTFLAKIPGQKGAGSGEGLPLPKLLDTRKDPGRISLPKVLDRREGGAGVMLGLYGVIWGYMGLYGGILGAYWGHIGGILGAYWGHMGSYGVIWVRFRNLKFET